MLQILFILFVYSLINCFQFAAGILANQTGQPFWRWFWISLIIPIISIWILLFLWDEEKAKAS